MRSSLLAFLLLLSLFSFTQSKRQQLSEFYSVQRTAVTADYKWTEDSIKKLEENKILNGFYNEYWIVSEDTNYEFRIKPLFNFSLGEAWENTRGIQLEARINDKISVESSFRESQSNPMDYVKSYADQTRVYPSYGRTRPYKEDGFDYSQSRAIVNLEANKVFTLELGYDNQFIGNGFRSVILDQSNYNYAYFLMQTNIGKIKYTNLYTKFLSLEHKVSQTDGYLGKYGSFQILEWNANKKLNLSLIQGIIQGNDTTAVRRGLDFNYWNPVIFVRPMEYAMGSPDNALIGLNVSFKLNDNIMFYSQALVDDINVSELKNSNNYFQQKFAGQLGVKGEWDKNDWRIYTGLELNASRPYVFAHKYTVQNYTHLGEPLAHQLGANFLEGVAWVGTHWKERHQLNLLVDYYHQGMDADSVSYGSNIFISDFNSVNGELSEGNEFLQGNLRKVLNLSFQYRYALSPKNDMSIGLKYIYREQTGFQSSVENNFRIVFSSNIFRENEVF